MDDRIEEYLPKRIRRDLEMVFPEYLSLREPRPKGHGPFQKRHALSNQGECVHALLPVVHYFARDAGAPEAAQLEKALGIVRQQVRPK